MLVPALELPAQAGVHEEGSLGANTCLSFHTFQNKSSSISMWSQECHPSTAAFPALLKPALQGQYRFPCFPSNLIENSFHGRRESKTTPLPTPPLAGAPWLSCLAPPQCSRLSATLVPVPFSQPGHTEALRFAAHIPSDVIRQAGSSQPPNLHSLQWGNARSPGGERCIGLFYITICIIGNKVSLSYCISLNFYQPDRLH